MDRNAYRDLLLIVAGPTASGKSALAIDAAEAFGGTVINADSMQIYRELRILTARPSEADEVRVPHRLFGVLSARERCSAGRWLKMVTVEIDAARAHGRLPIVVGGTGLYLGALTGGLAAIPPIPEAVREEGNARYDRLGGEAFRIELANRDAESAARLPSGDRQRLLRAWEVVRATGQTLPKWQRAAAEPGPAAGTAAIVLSPPREVLYAAIDARFRTMVGAGAVDEVKALLGLGLDPGLPAMKAVGVRELAGYLRGECSLDDAIAAASRASRNYAKRQMTWIRNRISGAIAIDAQYSERLKPKIFSFIRRFLLTPQT